MQKLSGLIIILILVSLIPLSTVQSNWNGQFTLSSATYSVGESGRTVSITIRLSGSRTGKKPWNATVSYATSNGTATAGSDYTATSGSRTFKKAGSWTFTIPITSDMASEGNETFTVSLSSPSNGSSLGSPNSAIVTIVDDDTAGITVTPTSGLVVSEAGSTAAFNAVLVKQPTANVTIGLSSSDTSEGTLSTPSLTFTTVNWNQTQTVTVTGVNDAVDDGDIPFTILTGAAVSTDANYNGLNPADVSVTNTDDDTAGITINPTSGLFVTEAGGTATFTVVLASQPSANVSLGLSSSDSSEGTVSLLSLVFTTNNWNSPQTVTITGVGDLELDGSMEFSIITSKATSSDPLYNNLDASDVLVTNIDDDTAGITVIHLADQTVTEGGGEATFILIMNKQPAADVTIALASSDTGEGTLSPDSLTFTLSNWNQSQVVTVTGVDDDVDDGDVAFMVIIAAAVSTDLDYNGLDPSDEPVTCLDNDTAGVTVTPIDGLTVTEAGGTDSFTVVLTSQPLADVTIDISSSNTLEGSVFPASLVFTYEDWDIAQTVTITGVDDPDPEGAVIFSIIIAAAVSDDPAYNGINASDVQVVNLDDDNSIPVGMDDSYSTLFGQALSVDSLSGVLTNDSDADGDPLVAVLVSDLLLDQGTLVFNDDGSFIYTPALGFSGYASFTYSADDGFDLSTPVTVTIQVEARYVFIPFLSKP
jgi:hypothetical protein